MQSPPPGGPPATPAAPSGFWADYWPHLTAVAGGVIAIVLGCLSSKGVIGPWGTAEDITLVVGGLAAGFGVPIAAAAGNRQ